MPDYQTNMKKCPKCGEPKGLIKCEKCHEEAVALEVNSLLDWRPFTTTNNKMWIGGLDRPTEQVYPKDSQVPRSEQSEYPPSDPYNP